MLVVGAESWSALVVRAVASEIVCAVSAQLWVLNGVRHKLSDVVLKLGWTVDDVS